VTLLIAALGTDRARAYATACPLPVEADMRHLDRAPLLTHLRHKRLSLSAAQTAPFRWSQFSVLIDSVYEPEGGQ
jgi:hypothetical protein